MNCKKILAGILSAAMVFTSMAIPAFADDNGSVASIGATSYRTLTDAITAAKDNDTVKLLSDVTESITVENGKNITLDLNGKTLTNVDGKDTITNHGTLSIKDSLNDKGTVDNVSNGKAALINDEDATATLNGGTFKRSKEAGKYEPYGNGGNSYYTIKNSGTMTINNGVVVENSGGYSSNIVNGGNSAEKTAQLTVNGGTFSGGINTLKNDGYGVLKIRSGIFNNTIQSCIMNWDVASISGGEFNGSKDVDSVYNGSYTYTDKDTKVDFTMIGDLTITGGTFTGAIVAVNYGGQATADPVTSITGGTFNTDVTKYCAEGYALKANKDGSYTVANVEDLTRMVAKIDSKYYETLTDAITAAKDNETVTLLSDVTESITVEKSKNITLDLNGKTLTNEADKHTITNNGTLTIKDSSNDKKGTVDNVSHARGALVNNDGGIVTLNGGKFDRSKENGTPGSNTWYTILNHGTMTINKATVNNKGKYSSNIANGYQANSEVAASKKDPTLIINDGNFSGGVITIKNDEKGDLTINNGIFTNPTNTTVFNWDKAVINGGTFNAVRVVDNGEYSENDKVVSGDVDITGGTFNGIVCPNPQYPGKNISITGGTFNTNVNSYCAEGFAPTKNADGTFTVKEKGITWDYGTDSGIYTAVDGNNYGVMRFMFSTDVDLSKSSVSKIGIKYINANAISDPINNKGTEVYANNASGKNAVQGDINEIIPESATGTYYALAYIEVDGKPYWSAPISCTLDTSKKLEGYTPQGGNE